VTALGPADVVHGDHRVGIGRGLAADVHDEEREHELRRRDVGREPAAGDEVTRRVHVGAGVLAEAPLLRVEAVGDDVHERRPRRRVEHGRVAVDREPGAERVRQVLDAAAVPRSAPSAVAEGAAGEGGCGCRGGGAGEDRAAVHLGRPL
jgi:hypothetical protein